MNVIAGPDPRDPECLPAARTDYQEEIKQGISGLRIAFSADLGFATVDPAVADIVEKSALRFSEAGATIERVELDWDDPYDCWRVFFYGARRRSIRPAGRVKRSSARPGTAAMCRRRPEAQRN